MAQDPGACGSASGLTSSRLGVLLLLVPLGILISEALRVPKSTPKSTPGDGYQVRIMTYDIRSAYGMEGRQDVEAIAPVIEGADTDMVALQELSRGWFMNGSTDLLPLLSRRLNMPYTIMGAATNPLFGNAILSRYPILTSGRGYLPQLDTLIRRGYVWAQIDLGAGDKLLVMTTHLETQKERTDGRMAQAQTVLNAWNGQPQTVLLSDMNAVSGSPEMQTILDAGFMDTWAEAGHGNRPRIDWIFHTPELIAREVMRVVSQASDHFAVVATIASKP